MRYWIYKNEKIIGPVARGELVGYSDLEAGTLVCGEGVSGHEDGDWKSISEIPELSDIRAPLDAPSSQAVTLGGQALSEAARWLGGLEPGSAAATFGYPEDAGPGDLFDSFVSGVPASIHETRFRPVEHGDQVSDLLGRISELELRQRELLKSLEERFGATAPATQEPPQARITPRRFLPATPPVAPPPSAPPPAPEAPTEEERGSETRAAAEALEGILPTPAGPAGPAAVIPAPPPVEEEGPKPVPEPAFKSRRWSLAAESWPLAKPDKELSKKTPLKLAPPKSFSVIGEPRSADSLAGAESYPDSPDAAGGLPAASVAMVPQTPEPDGGRAGDIPSLSEPVSALPPVLEQPEAALLPDFHEEAQITTTPGGSAAETISVPASAPIKLEPPKIEAAPVPPLSAPISYPTPAPLPLPTPVSAPVEKPRMEPVPTPNLGSLVKGRSEAPAAAPPMTMRFAVGTAPGAEPGAHVKQSSATEEVISRLAKHSDESKSLPPKPKRRPTKTFAIAIGAAVLILVVLFYAFFRNTKEVNLLFNMGEGQPPLAAGAEDETRPVPDKPRPLQAPPADLQQAAPIPRENSAQAVPAIPPADIPAAVPPDPGAEAVEIVKNFTLPGGRATIGQRLQAVHPREWGAPDKDKWDAGANDATTFIVQYTVQAPSSEGAAKTITYLFEADINLKTVKGNNQAAKKLLQAAPARKDASAKRQSRRAGAPKREPRAPAVVVPDADQSLGPPEEAGSTPTGDGIE